MRFKENSVQECMQKTRFVFLATRLLNVPFWGVFYIFPFLIHKNLQATPSQVTCVIALKPLVALLAPYWSIWIYERPDRLVQNLVWANILKYIPLLFFPWIHNVWLLVGSFGFYWFLKRGTTPAWMEIIKSNIQGKAREKVFQLGTLIDYIGTAVLTFAAGWLLDHDEESWRWIFFGAGVVGILTTGLLLRLPIKGKDKLSASPPLLFFQKEDFWKPFKESWKLLAKRPDFTCFQIGFMLGGGGLMIMQPILPNYFMDVLSLSYTNLLTAVTICKGVGFAIASPYCVKKFQKKNIFYFCSWVTCCAAFFPLFLMAAKWHIFLLYFGYLIYGIMQAGSELSWHMSGPVFSGNDDSSLYTGTNILSVGIRGCIAPFLGSQLYGATNSLIVLAIGSCLCFLATERMWSFSRAYGFSYQHPSSR